MDVIEWIQLEASIGLCILHCGFCHVQRYMKIVKNHSAVDSSEAKPLHLMCSKCVFMQLQQERGRAIRGESAWYCICSAYQSLNEKAGKSLGGLEEDEPVRTGLKIAFQPKWNVIPYIVFSCYSSFPRMPKSKELVSSSSSASDSDSEVDEKVNNTYNSLLY